MRYLVVALLATGCSEHGSSPPDAEMKVFLDAPVDTCFAPDGSANVTATPTFTFGRIYVGGVFGSGLFARGVPGSLQLLVTNTPSAGFEIFGLCNGGAGCPEDGLFVTTIGQIDTSSFLGSHRVSIARTRGGSAAVEGSVTITEYVDPLETLPGHLTGTISTTTPSITVNGSFASAFCPAYMQFPI